MIRSLLCIASDNARLALIAGLVAGFALPDLAALLERLLPQMVAALLVVTALRVGPNAVRGAVSDLRWGLGAVAALQLALPLCVLVVCKLAGFADTSVATALVLATAAPALSGSPNLALLLGQDAGRMMQLLVLGTAAFPLTVLPLLIMLPDLGSPAMLTVAALKLLVVIVAATAAGFALRIWKFAHPQPETLKALDGLAVLTFSGVVIGLMAALTPALQTDPADVAVWAAIAFTLCYGLQTSAYCLLRWMRWDGLAGPIAIGAGNRNIALFLVALPAETMAPLMVFVGCWQLPMYLTPILLRWLYQRDP